MMNLLESVQCKRQRESKSKTFVLIMLERVNDLNLLLYLFYELFYGPYITHE